MSTEIQSGKGALVLFGCDIIMGITTHHISHRFSVGLSKRAHDETLGAGFLDLLPIDGNELPKILCLS